MSEQHRLPTPHAAPVTPGLYARAMTLPVAPAVATEVALAYHLILDVLRDGHGIEDHLASMMQVALKTRLIGERGHVKLSEPVFRTVQEGIVRCRRVGLRTGQWELDPATYTALCQVLAIFDRQLATAPFYEILLASGNGSVARPR